MKPLTLSLLIGWLLLLPACKKQVNTQLCDNEVAVLNLDLLEQNLVQKVEADNPMGYAYVIAKDGQVERQGYGGLARSAAEGNLPMNTNSIMHIASVSKTITSAAVLRLLDEKGLTVNDTIYHYLPPRWQVAESTKKITFHYLLSHRVAYPIMGKGGSVSYDSLRAYAERGMTYTSADYSNINHSFFRIIIPRLWDKYRPADGAYSDSFTASVYEKYIQEEMFQPLGITATLNTVGNNNMALAYSGANDNAGKFGPEDHRYRSGAYGWQMSAYETAKFWAYLWFSTGILSDYRKDVMKAGYYGLSNTISGEHGTYFGKRGEWVHKDDNGIKRTYNTFVILYPDNVQVTLFINSPISTSMSGLLRDAYDEAFVNECL